MKIRLAPAIAALLAAAACSEPEPAKQAEGATAAMTPTPAMVAYTADADAMFAGGEPVTPAEVRAMIETDGAQRTVSALYGDGERSRWTTVLAGIAKAEPAWLALVAALEPGTENDSYYGLDAALKAGLVVDPVAILALLTPGGEDLSPASVCFMDGIEWTPDMYAAYYDALTPAVERVTDPAVAANRDACLTVLRARAGA